VVLLSISFFHRASKRASQYLNTHLFINTVTDVPVCCTTGCHRSERAKRKSPPRVLTSVFENRCSETARHSEKKGAKTKISNCSSTVSVKKIVANFHFIMTGRWISNGKQCVWACAAKIAQITVFGACSLLLNRSTGSQRLRLTIVLRKIDARPMRRLHMHLK